MIGFVFRTFRFLKYNVPYQINIDAPEKLKQLWNNKIWRIANKRFLIAHLFTILLWRNWHRFRALFKTTKLSQEQEVSKSSSFRQAILKERIHPFYFNYFSLHQTNIWPERHQFLYHLSLQHLLKDLNTNKHSCQILNDKLTFNNYCKGKYPIPELFGYAESGNLSLVSTTWPWQAKSDFIIKPKVGSKGRGVERMTYQSKKNGYYNSREGRVIPIPMIEEFLRFKSRINKSCLLIQENLKNHSALMPFCNDALSVIRILSIRDQLNKPVLTRPIIQFPQGRSILSYLHTGAKVYAINLESGRIEKSLHQEGNQEPLFLPIPYWEEVKSLCVDLHHNIPDLNLIGWDVAISQDGPILLEGNISPSLDTHQRPPFGPFIASEFYEHFVYHLGKNGPA